MSESGSVHAHDNVRRGDFRDGGGSRVWSLPIAAPREIRGARAAKVQESAGGGCGSAGGKCKRSRAHQPFGAGEGGSGGEGRMLAAAYSRQSWRKKGDEGAGEGGGAELESSGSNDTAEGAGGMRLARLAA